MIITYYGKESFKVQFGETTLSFNPVGKNSSHKSARFSADVALVSLNHPDFNGTESAAYAGKEPFVIDGPGEYEIKGVFVRGLPTETTYGGKKKMNAIYVVTLENMNLCFLGALGNAALSDKNKEALESIDVLFAPIGGGELLNAEAAVKLANNLEPNIVIPIDYEDGGKKGALGEFLKESGAEKPKPLDKLTIKKKDIEGKEGEIVVLEPYAG